METLFVSRFSIEGIRPRVNSAASIRAVVVALRPRPMGYSSSRAGGTRKAFATRASMGSEHVFATPPSICPM